MHKYKKAFLFYPERFYFVRFHRFCEFSLLTPHVMNSIEKVEEQIVIVENEIIAVDSKIDQCIDPEDKNYLRTGAAAA